MTSFPNGVAPAAKDRPALRRCVAVDPDVFAGRYWSRRPLLSAAADLPSGFDDLLTLDAVDDLLSRRGLRTPFLRVAKDGKVSDGSAFTGSGGAGAEISDQVRDDQVAALFADGSTLVLQALHRTWPALVDFAGQLAVDLGHPVQVNAYVTPPSNRGFDPHYDTHDVFVLQVAGQKRWRIHEPVVTDPLRSQPWADHRAAVAERAADEPTIDTVLNPGDALYLPRGYLHSAEALGGVSAHLTIGVHAVTRYAVTETLLAMAAEDAAGDPALRRSLPLGVDVADPADVTDPAEAVVDALRGWLDSVDPQRLAERLRTRVWTASRPGPVGPLAQAAAAAAVDATTRFAVRPHLRSRLEDAGERVLLHLADRTLDVPAAVGPALRAVLAGDVTRVADLPGLDPDEQVVLARRLFREAVVVPAPG
jgi:bifunctional lysine-specific demethylase and histidyl-hydroxylase NO66